jgi:hypothetical protein
VTTVPLAERETAVYRLFDIKRVLLYVGISCAPSKRFKGHQRDKEWWSAVHHNAIEWHPDRITALRREAAAIADEHPLYNLAHPDPTRISVAVPVVQPAVELPGLSFEGASRRLGVRAAWIRNKVRVGVLHHHCDGPLVWFTEGDLKHIIAMHQVLERGADPQRVSEHNLARGRATLALSRLRCRHVR